MRVMCIESDWSDVVFPVKIEFPEYGKFYTVIKVSTDGYYTLAEYCALMYGVVFSSDCFIPLSDIEEGKLTEELTHKIH